MANLNIRNQRQKAFSPNSRIALGIDLGGKVRRGCLILSGPIVLSAGSTSGTAIGDGGPLNLIQHIYLRAIAAGGFLAIAAGTLSMPTRVILMVNATWQRNGKRFDNLRGGTLGDGVAATYDVYLSIPLYFADATQKNCVSTALNTEPGVYSDVQLEVLTGSVAACFPGNDRTVDYSRLELQWKDDRVALPGDTLELYQENHVLQLPATNKRFVDESLPKDGSYLSWQLMSQLNTDTVATLSDALLNKVVINGPTIDYDLFADDIRQTMLDDEWLDPSQDGTGLHFIDFTDGALQANTVPANTFGTYMDVNAVSGANLDSISVFTRRVMAQAPAASAA